MGAVAQRAKSGDVIGVQMGIDRLDQFKVQLVDELKVSINLDISSFTLRVWILWFKF